MADTTLQIKKLTETAKLPQKAHEEDAALDLFVDTTEDIYILPGTTKVVQTGLAIMPEKGWSCDIRGRSGMNSKGKLVILGLVDAFYQGPWGVIVYNSTAETVKLSHHDKFAQFTINRVWDVKLDVVTEFRDGSTRGTGGFGSSGN
jgi:dUTP pyrophosphatase